MFTHAYLAQAVAQARIDALVAAASRRRSRPVPEAAPAASRPVPWPRLATGPRPAATPVGCSA